MGYFNGNKVFQVVKTVDIPKYKHHVKMQGFYKGVDYTIYADIISNDGTNWAEEEYGFADIPELVDNGWTGVIAGYDNQSNKFQYAHLGNNGVSYQSEVYYNIENRGSARDYVTIDAYDLGFVSDTVTQIN